MNDAEFQKLLNAEPPMVISPWPVTFLLSGITWIGMAGLSLWIGMHFARQNHDMTALWVIGVPPPLIMMFLMYTNIGYRLTLGRNGFTLRNFLLGRKFYAWKDVSDIVGHTYVFGGARWIIQFFYHPQNSQRQFYHPDVYGSLSMTQLAALMNHWRERALSSNSHLS